MKKLGVSLLVLSTLAFNVWAMGELSFNRNLSVDKNNAKSVFIDVGSGSLNVRGDDVDEIIVNAKVHSKKYKSINKLEDVFMDKMTFSLEQKGSKIFVKAFNKKKMFGWSNPEISIDLDIVVPRSMDVEIDDGSGSMTVTGIQGNLEIDDGSGSSYIDNIGGNLVFDDGSGNLEISNVAGDVNIDDGSGKLIVTSINGSVYIDDGSGLVDIKDVLGDVTIDDGSGSINVTALAGNFNLINGGSGKVFVNGSKWLED